MAEHNGNLYTDFTNLSVGKDTNTGIYRFGVQRTSALTSSDDKAIYFRGGELRIWDGTFERTLSAGARQVATGTITSAQLKASFTTPVTLIAAPGAGKYIRYDFGYFWHAAGTAYTSNDHTIRYTNGSGATVSATLTASGFTTSTATEERVLRNITTSLEPVTNAPLVFFTGTADPTTGDFDISYEIYYEIVTAHV